MRAATGRTTAAASAVLAALVLTTAARPTAAQNGQTDLDALVGWPFPSALTAAPASPVVAWVRNERGARNIWTAAAPGWSGRRLTSFTRDDGQEITQLAVSADGSLVAFVRGGAPNRAGEIPNPESDPAGVDREIWVAPTDGSGAQRLGPGHSPVLSPDGAWVIHIDRGVIQRRPARDPSASPEPLVRGRGSPGELRLSPDGTHLAWTSGRGDHAFIGVLDLESGTLRYLDPSLDQDGNPAWSPDGREIAFLRIPSRQDRLPFFAVRESIPWSIRVVNLDSGSARTVFTAPEGPGSAFRTISGPNNIFWGADDRIAFPWEGNGFTNLYSIAAQGGGEPRPIATGDFEVQYVTAAPGGEALVFSSNEGDVDRQHLWWGPLDGSGARLLTPGTGIEWQPAPTTDGSVVFLASAGTVPAHAEVLSGDERRWLVPGAMDGIPTGLADPIQVVFPATDGVRIHGQLFLPTGAPPPGGWPGVLFLHGGSRRQMLLGFHHRGYYHNTYSFNQHLAANGYAVLSVNFRSGIGYGMEFREALHYGADGASEVNDVLGAGVYMASRDDVDGDRIGLWGGSYGGYLTAHGLAQASHLFKAGVDIHGVHDWNKAIRNFVPSYEPAARPELARRAFESSPMAFVERWTSPVLLIHGDDDRNVPFAESVELAEVLRGNGVHVEHLVFPDEVHGFLLHRNWMAAFRAAQDFFDRFLKAR
ncbi:MAG: prolyl oligopeptidase family serine peptidase [Gemmatimonadetes bacterium]|nr:prolyl oligopeptidase family serine peptidase [Gemmatimonadota bacterium]